MNRPSPTPDASRALWAVGEAWFCRPFAAVGGRAAEARDPAEALAALRSILASGPALVFLSREAAAGLEPALDELWEAGLGVLVVSGRTGGGPGPDPVRAAVAGALGAQTGG